MKSWAAMPFEFQWQNGKDDCLGPGLISISPQQFNKAFINSRQSISTFPAWRWYVTDQNVEKM